VIENTRDVVLFLHACTPISALWEQDAGTSRRPCSGGRAQKPRDALSLNASACFLLLDPMWTIVQTCSVKTDKGKGGGAPKASATTKTTSGTTMSGGGKAAGGGPATARSSLQSPSHAPDTTPRCVSQSPRVELPFKQAGLGPHEVEGVCLTCCRRSRGCGPGAVACQ
jgi:hypothetical protein